MSKTTDTPAAEPETDRGLPGAEDDSHLWEWIDDGAPGSTWENMQDDAVLYP